MILVRSTAAMLHCRLWIRRRPIINITLRPTKANSAQLPTFAQLLSLPALKKKKTAFASRHQRRRPNSTAKPSSLTASGHRTEEDELRQRNKGVGKDPSSVLHSVAVQGRTETRKKAICVYAAGQAML